MGCESVEIVENPSVKRLRKFGPAKKIHYHGMSKHKLIGVYRTMLNRCDPKIRTENERYYSEAGVTVCDEWKRNPMTFFGWAFMTEYRPGMTLGRIGDAKVYSPSTCRWETPAQQARNKRNNVWLTAFGVTSVLADWKDHPKLACSLRTLGKRIRSGEWSDEDAITTPPTNPRVFVHDDGRSLTVAEWHSTGECHPGVTKGILACRLGRGWDLDRAMQETPRPRTKS